MGYSGQVWKLEDKVVANITGRILISPTSYGKCGIQPLELLKERNYEIILNPFGRKMTSDEVIKFGKDCIGIIAGVEPLDARVLQSLSSLRCISRCGVGIDNIDLCKAEELGIIVKNTPDGPTRAVAELAIGVILDILRRISLRDRELRRGNWNKKMGCLLQNKKVGILGLGRIGRAVAELLLGLGADVAGTDNNPSIKWHKTHNVPLLGLEELLRESDIVCIHISYAENNRHLIGKKEIKLMKKGAYIINLSRGGIVDEDALYQALNGGRLSGAAVDVFEQEPYTGPLTELSNIVLTPHIGSYARESRLKMEIEAVNNLLGVLEKKNI
jgi:D-3-phosphoglycerate dehydrogenase